MERDKENQPIDDLFARKLGNLSLPPSADGFERLQARMNQHDQKTKVVFWRNPVMQRYIAAAACLLLVCLFGWLYLSDADKNESQIATRKTRHLSENNGRDSEKAAQEAIAKTDQSNLSKESSTETITKTVPKAGKSHAAEMRIARIESESQIARNSVPTVHIDVAETNQTSISAHPTGDNNKIDHPIAINATNSPTQERLAENTPKANAPTERVLVVTIEEPATLVAARQVKTSADEKVAIAIHENDSKETKGNGIWQQVKRLKHGELFARSDNATNDDQGLLSRAYTGLKQSFDKGKSTKQ